MARVTPKDLDRKAEWLARATGLPINIQRAYGRSRVYIGDGRHISPALPTGQLLDWMEAFQTGMEYAPRRGFFQEPSIKARYIQR